MEHTDSEGLGRAKVSDLAGYELTILLASLAALGWWLLVTRRRGTPLVPLKTFLLNLLVVGGTLAVSGAGHMTGHTRDYGVLAAALMIAVFQAPGLAPKTTDLFTRVVMLLGAWWILLRG